MALQMMAVHVLPEQIRYELGQQIVLQRSCSRPDRRHVELSTAEMAAIGGFEVLPMLDGSEDECQLP